MLIDWFTVSAQIVNFIVLVFLLKKFLYKPVLQVITDRQEAIAKQLSDADMKKNEAEEECSIYQGKNKEFEQQKEEKIKQLNEEIKQMRNNLTSETKQQIDEQRTKWLSNLDSEKGEVFRELSQRIKNELFSIVRKTLADLADTDVQERIVDTFLKQLKNLPQKQKDDMLAVLHTSPSLQIKTATELPNDLREKIKASVKHEFNNECDIQFVAAPELIGGVELKTGGQKISWNIADYLSSLEQLNSETIHG